MSYYAHTQAMVTNYHTGKTSKDVNFHKSG